MAKNANLRSADRNKADEFYTQLSDIEKELTHYNKHFANKTVFCNCDDPRVSQFFYHFAMNFKFYGLKRLITTCYKNTNPDLFSQNAETHGLGIDYDGSKFDDHWAEKNELDIKILDGNGDFRSPECVELLKQADIVCTNPPFSLFREYVSQLVEHDKKFIILGNQNAITYKEIFKLFMENKIWLGYGFNMSVVYKTPYPNKLEANKKFVLSKGYNPDEGYVKVPAICWFTNLDIKKRHEELILYKHYTPEEYPKYDDYDAINVDKVAEIPMDYDGLMGVPITFLDKYNPEQFEIVDGLNRYSILYGKEKYPQAKYLSMIEGKPLYVRIVIRRRQK